MRPWLGDEAAYAAVSPADTLLLAAVADRAGAEALVARIGNLDTAATHRGVRVLSAGPTSLAFVRDDVLAVGTAAAVRAAIDRAQGEGDTLAGSPLYERATAGRPGGRTLDLYASAQGVREILAARDGLLGTAGALLDREGLEAAAASLAAEEDGLRIARAARGRRVRGRVVHAGPRRARAGGGRGLPRREDGLAPDPRARPPRRPGRPSTRCARCSPTTPASTSTASSSRRSRARSRSP